MSSRRIVDLRKGRPAPREASGEQPLSRSSERRSPLKTARRKLRLIDVLIALAVCAGLIFGAFVVSYLPRFTIQKVNATGTTHIHASDVVTYVNGLLDDGKNHFLSRRNIFLYPKRELTAGLAVNFPRIRSVSYSRESIFSQDLTIVIAERAPFAKWCMSDQAELPGTCFVMDDHGFIFDALVSAEQPPNPYIFKGGILSSAPIGVTYAPGHLPGIVALMKLLANAEFTPFSADIQNDQDFFITLQQGCFIKASYGQEASLLVRNLQLILNSATLKGREAELDYIDLRFGNRVYYKFKGQPEAPAP